MHNILICDDDRDIVAALKIYLTSEDYRLFEAYTGRQALEIAERERIDLILMDIMMPELDGIAATVKLRQQSNVPIILLTAKSENSDKVLGLDVGADDYITKPFDPAEVLARVRSQLRRYTALGARVQQPDRYVIGGIELDDAGKTVTVDGEAVSLTPIEYDILLLLMKNPGRVFSSASIYEQVWNAMPIGSEGAVPVHIRHLREKLEINPSESRYIKVVWGQGYKMERVRTDVGEMVRQCVGEYTERLAAGRLEPVVTLPEQPAHILADGRLLWRIMDNLLGNVCKYAQPGTRVYLDVGCAGGEVVLAVKNISRERLNIPAEELMERFVRGDMARSTEGSGLGLNIARSLTELQEGSFRLSVDGDLFKAELHFPAV